MISKLIKRIQEEFFKQIQTKSYWGRMEIIVIYRKSVLTVAEQMLFEAENSRQNDI
jgi:hypothetical protein